MFKLYDYFRSTACFRVRIALQLKNLPYETLTVQLVEGEQFAENYTRINCQSRVPTLQIGNQIFTQSLAIIEYLDEIYPEPALFPKSAYVKALIRAFALTIAADVHPLNNLGVLKYLTQELQISEMQKKQWYHNWVAKGFHALEKQLQQRQTNSDFCFGDTPTLADICLVAQMYNARRFDCDLKPYPSLVRIDANCQRLSAFKAAWPIEEKVT